MKLLSESLPDKIKSHGRAWRCDLKRVELAAKEDGRDITGHATVCMWVVEAKWAHPIWSNYLIYAIHLRPMPGRTPPVINLEGATHEVHLYALQPNVDLDLDRPADILIPVNFVGQWIAGTDFEAEQKIEGCVDRIIHGNLSPDTDYIRMWVELFSASNLKPGHYASPNQRAV